MQQIEGNDGLKQRVHSEWWKNRRDKQAVSLWCRLVWRSVSLHQSGCNQVGGVFFSFLDGDFTLSLSGRADWRTLQSCDSSGERGGLKPQRMFSEDRNSPGLFFFSNWELCHWHLTQFFRKTKRLLCAPADNDGGGAPKSQSLQGRGLETFLFFSLQPQF